jgi:hypothetical protein
MLPVVSALLAFVAGLFRSRASGDLEHNAGIRFSFTLTPGEWRSAPFTRSQS